MLKYGLPNVTLTEESVTFVAASELMIAEQGDGDDELASVNDTSPNLSDA